MFMRKKKAEMPNEKEALPGRETAIPITQTHYVNHHPVKPPFADNFEQIIFGMGCFWGAEHKFWQAEGVYTTAVGYSGGYTRNPSYEEVCSGQTGHNEVVLVVWDPAITDLGKILRIFWESHNPTEGMRQGNDIGTQYRSGIYCFNQAQIQAALASRIAYQDKLSQSGYADITTEIVEAGPFYYAEDYHQQYLAKNPGGYCGMGGTGIICP